MYVSHDIWFDTPQHTQNNWAFLLPLKACPIICFLQPALNIHICGNTYQRSKTL